MPQLEGNRIALLSIFYPNWKRDIILQKSIVYFQDPGEQNTAQVIQAAKERAIELDIKEIVVASTSGKTGVAMANALKGTEIRTVAATQKGL